MAISESTSLVGEKMSQCGIDVIDRGVLLKISYGLSRVI